MAARADDDTEPDAPASRPRGALLLFRKRKSAPNPLTAFGLRALAQ